MSISPRSSERILIRHPVASDEREFTELRRRNRDFLETWEPIPPSGHLAFTTDDFEFLLSTAQTDVRRRFLIVNREEKRIMGQASLGNIMRGPLEQAFLGYWIGREFARRGFMLEALPLVLAYGFAELLLHRVEANIQPGNEPSIGLVEKVGFRNEGFSPKYLKIQGRWSDHFRYAILEEEFWLRYPELQPR